ncbi:MAG: amidohydrolase [Oscillospiraceae bacterium]|nr:amidohydrolase [Oscillospiraceae bacterium]
MIRFYNGKVLTLCGFATEITDSEVWVDGDSIIYVGEKRVDSPLFEREIDLKGNLLMPSFKNAHSHSAMTFLRSFADDLPLKEWLFDRVFPLEDKLTPDKVYHLTKSAVLEYLSSGITAAMDMYFFPDACAQANIDCGFRTVICSGVGGSAEGVKRLEREWKHFTKLNPLVSYSMGFHAEYTCEYELLKGIGELAQEYKAPVFTHNSETENEVAECRARYGMTPTQLFESLHIYDNGGGGFHCVYLDDEDVEIFQRRKLHIVSCPASNAKLASGIAPLCRYAEKGISLGLGTDGAASNNALDMFREMYLATVLQKLSCADASAMPAETVLKMATSGSAHAMGLTDCDCIDAGKKADLIVVDLNQPNMQPVNNIVKNLVYSACKQNVVMTMVNGRILYENGEFFVGDSVDNIYNNANRIVKEICN